MSPKQWLALFCFYISYLFFGASVFYHIEHELEAKRRAINLQRRIDINEILVKYTAPNDTAVQNEILRRVTDYCGKPVTNYTLDTYQEPMIWSFYHAFFFSFTVCSTVGYGNISPSNTFGRMFMILYALIGIPVNGFLFAYLGEFFGKAFLSAYERYKAYKIATTKNYAPHRLGLIAQILVYLLPGIVIFLFLPSLIFSYFEDWPYTVSFYYSFVTLSTIGFGDFVPTFEPNQERNFGFIFHVYEVFIIFWFIFGLGYLVMIMGFIAKGLRSKHLTRLEHQLAENLKSTHNRIWNGVTKDVGYIRRILNEAYIMKFKPVYTEPGENDNYDTERRSSSCPDLSIYRSQERAMRKRAQSLFYPAETDLLSVQMNRIQSDGDLRRVNRKRTFNETNQLSRPSDLLARVVTALNNIRTTDDDDQSVLDLAMTGGVHGFTDSQILASEKTNSKWSLAYSDGSYAVPPARYRSRAASDFRAPTQSELQNSDEHKWTWSGNNSQIKEFMRMRKRKSHHTHDLYRAAFGQNKGSSVIVNVEPPVEAISPAVANNSIFNRLNPFRKRSSNNDSKRVSPAPDRDRLDVQNYLDRTAAGRESHLSVSTRQYLNATARGRSSNFSILSMTDDNNADVLEKTTIADLIRALEVVHTKANMADTPLLQDYFNDPKRKMGTASLTPPSDLPPLINVFPTHGNYARRSSMRPQTTQTPIFNRVRRQSNILDHLTSSKRSSLLRPPSGQPPPYSESVDKTRPYRRFSIRPTLLSIPPGQSPAPSFTPAAQFQRRSSLRPSPLAMDPSPLRASARFKRSVSSSMSSGSGTPTSIVSTPATRRRNLALRPVTEGIGSEHVPRLFTTGDDDDDNLNV